MRRLPLGIATGLLVTGTLAGAQSARDQISVVGSSTVYPFATVVAERFGQTTDFKTPKIESTGSGGGMKLFCAGVGVEHPDITNSSRQIKKSEFDQCQQNGVTDVLEVLIGYDGIALANATSAPLLELSRRDIFLALAKQVPNQDGTETFIDNPYSNWAEVNPELPDTPIEVMGPPPTSGTRDAFAELALEGGCKTFHWIEALEESDKYRYKEVCHTVREDGAYIEAGENDNLIVQKLETNPNALGIFGYSFLEQNEEKVQGSIIDGHEPTFESIADGEYPISRPLYFYVKMAHEGIIPGIGEYLEEFTLESTWGEDGYLADRGMIPLGDEEREEIASAVSNRTPLDM